MILFRTCVKISLVAMFLENSIFELGTLNFVLLIGLEL
jgi:hypothetical protein